MIKQILSKNKFKRGMNFWHDVIDWLGGYPFEVSTPKQVFDYLKNKEFELSQLNTVGGKLGCNEFVFKRKT